MHNFVKTTFFTEAKHEIVLEKRLQVMNLSVNELSVKLNAWQKKWLSTKYLSNEISANEMLFKLNVCQ